MDLFLKSDLNHCPFFLVFLCRSLKNKIYNLDERCLRIIYNGKKSNLEESIIKDNSVSIHHKNTRTHITEVWRCTNLRME